MEAVDTLRLDLHGYWHCGTGQGRGSELDAVVQRTPAGLPYVPGKTLKGLLREAAGLALSDSQVTEMFGKAILAKGGDSREGELEEARFQAGNGGLAFGSATLGPVWEAWATADAEQARQDKRAIQAEPLYRALSSTRINEHGVAEDHTLRTIEVAVPMTLFAEVRGPQHQIQALAEVVPLVRALGSHRHRGLGRVTVRLGGRP